jgi:hypothetical protein
MFAHVTSASMSVHVVDVGASFDDVPADDLVVVDDPWLVAGAEGVVESSWAAPPT